MTKEGEPFHSTLLFHDLLRNAWEVFTLDEYDETFVYDEIAVIQGMHLIKGAKDSSGNLKQKQPSGNWYFYLPGKNQLIRSSLDPNMKIIYATADEAFIVKEQDIYKAALSDNGLSEPVKLITMPTDEDIFRIYPLNPDLVVPSTTYILVSTQEEAMIDIPCRLYHISTTEPCLSMVTEISPQKGIRLVEAYPHQRKIAIWRYEEDKTGSLVIVDVDMPEDLRSVSLPFEPVLGGYLVKDTQGEPLFVTGNPSKTQKQFYAYSVLSDHLQPIQTVQWDTVIIHGTNTFRTGGGRLLNVSIDPESGEISYDSGGVRAPFAFRFDDATLQAFNQMKTRATQIWGNNEKYCILGAQETGENRTHFFVFMYDKILQHWEHVAVEGIYSYIQLFERWMLIQQAFRSDERGVSDPIKITGQYTFYDLDTQEHFVWQTVPHNEVLGIWGDTILYRIDDELFEATITQTGISHAQRIVQDPIIQDVHWAFIVP